MGNGGMNPRYGVASVLAYAFSSQLYHVHVLPTNVVLIDSLLQIDGIVFVLFVVMGGVGFDGNNVW